MAAPAYSNDLITIATGDLNFDAGTWDESTDAGWDTAGAMVDDENLWYTENSTNTGEAVNSCTSAQYTKSGIGSGTTGPGTIMYVHTAAFTVPANGVCLIHILWAAPTSLNVYEGTANTAEAGISVLVGDSLGVFDIFYTSGSNKPPAPEGGWATFVVDPTLTPDNSVGAPTTTTMVGSAIAATAQARGNPHAVQAIRYGRGEAEYTLGELATPATFAGYATVDNAAADRFNLLQEIEGGYKARGLMSFGTAATAVYFDDSNVNISIADDLKVGSAFNKGIVTHASSELYWTNVSITNLGAVSKYTFTVNDSAITEHTGCVFTDVGAFSYGANSINTGTTYRRQELITQLGATFTGCTFDKSIGATTLLSTELDLITDCDFISDGSNYAVELNTVGDGTMSWGNKLTGYETGVAGSPVTGTTTGNEAIFVNVGTGTLTINVAAGATLPSVRTAGATVNVVSSFTLTLTNILSGTQVTIVDSTTRAELQNSTSTGVDITYSHAGGNTVDILLIHLDYDPNDASIYDLTLDSGEQSIKFQQGDDRNYSNPENEPVIELYPQNNAASIGTEIDANGPVVANTSTLTRETSDTYHGTYAFKCVSTNDSWGRAEFNFDVIDTHTYQVRIRAKRGAQGVLQRFASWTGFSDFSTVNITTSLWDEYIFNLTANITGAALIRIYATATGGAIGDEVWFDAISIIET